jgi:serine/threonine protein kinase
MHASLRYDDVASSGSPSRPLEFPTPKVYRCQKVELRARDHRSGTIHNLQNVILRSELDEFGRRATVAYLLKKKLCKSIYGSVRLGLCLKRIGSSSTLLSSYENQAPESREDRFSDCSSDDDCHHVDVQWESTDVQVAIKASSWVKINSLRGKHLEDPIKEVAAMQHLGNYEPNILGALESLQDDDYLYTVMTYLPGGDLFGRINGEAVGPPSSSPSSVTSYLQPMGVSESQAREWFRQLLKVRKKERYSPNCMFMSITRCNIVSSPLNLILFSGIVPSAKEGSLPQGYFTGEPLVG